MPPEKNGQNLSMKHAVKLPRLGDAVDEVVVIELLVDVGEMVDVGTPILLVETDKITTDVPSPVQGRLVSFAVEVGSEVRVGSPIAIVEAQS